MKISPFEKPFPERELEKPKSLGPSSPPRGDFESFTGEVTLQGLLAEFPDLLDIPGFPDPAGRGRRTRRIYGQGGSEERRAQLPEGELRKVIQNLPNSQANKVAKGIALAIVAGLVIGGGVSIGWLLNALGGAAAKMMAAGLVAVGSGIATIAVAIRLYVRSKLKQDD